MSHAVAHLRVLFQLSHAFSNERAGFFEKSQLRRAPIGQLALGVLRKNRKGLLQAKPRVQLGGLIDERGLRLEEAEERDLVHARLLRNAAGCRAPES